MKIRNSFVTNSSSSSFILIGKNTKIEDVKINEKEYICLGRYLSDGQDVFDLTHEIYEYLRSGEYPFETYYEKLEKRYSYINFIEYSADLYLYVNNTVEQTWTGPNLPSGMIGQPMGLLLSLTYPS